MQLQNLKINCKFFFKHISVLKMLNIALKCQWYTYPICQNEFFKGKGWILDSSVSEVPPLTWFITHCFIIWWFYLVISSMKHLQQNSLSNERNFQRSKPTYNSTLGLNMSTFLNETRTIWMKKNSPTWWTTKRGKYLIKSGLWC